MIAVTRVNIQTVNFDLACRGIEVLKLQLADSTAVHCIGEVRAESLHVEMVGSLTDLFVRCETDTNLAVLDFGVLYQVLHCCHNLCNAGFVVSAEQGSGVRHDDVLTCVARIDIVALLGLHYRGLHMFAARIRRRVHVGDKTEDRYLTADF